MSTTTRRGRSTAASTVSSTRRPTAPTSSRSCGTHRPRSRRTATRIPTTWDDLIALTEQITEDHAEGATKAWCAGIGSGDATGWPATDWMEDLILRNNGPEVYDQWWKHEIPFNDPQVVEALDQAGEILKNPEYVNGGLGDVSTIATTTFQDGGLPILDGSCFLHRQASFYAANFQDAGAGTVAEDGDVFAFYLPGPTEDEKPVLVGGEFTAAFRSAPEVEAFQAYLTSPEWANLRAQGGLRVADPPTRAWTRRTSTARSPSCPWRFSRIPTRFSGSTAPTSCPAR